ncbi:peptidylprolyl isomerase, partial [bacterium]|nr:peptidylprolyl isomerase [bacterium]
MKTLKFTLASIFLLFTKLVFAQTVVEWRTSMGNFRVELREDLVPITANNFITLTNNHFYDGLIFHRVIDNFMIQDGDPLGNGTGGPGYTIPDEFTSQLLHDSEGVLSMANAGPNTGGSQYFITLVPTTWLNYVHSAFGRVISGINVVQNIGDVPTDANDKPLTDVVIDSIRVLGIIYPHVDLAENEIAESSANNDGDGILNPLETGKLTVKLKNWATWQNAQNTTGTLTCDDSTVTILNGTVNFGTLANGDSVSNELNPFLFASSTAKTLTTNLRLKITANPTSANPYEVNYTIPFSITLNQAGFPFTVVSRSSALIFDLDGNGSKELVFGDDTGKLHALNSDGQTELAGFPVNLGTSSIRSAVAIGEINNSPNAEIVVASLTGGISLVDFTGNIIFNHSVSGLLYSNPIIADADGNGTNEIVAVSNTGQITVLNANGSNFSTFPLATGLSGVLSSPTVADLNNDNSLEIIFCSSANGGSLHAFSTSNGQEIAGFPFVLGSVTTNGTIVSDLDGNGTDEILVGLNNGDLKVVKNDGTLFFTKNTSTAIKTSPLAYDLDGNGSVEIIFVNNDGMLFVTNNQGNDIFTTDTGAGTECTPVLADLNGNGTADIIFGDADGFLQAIDFNGASIPNFPVLVGSNLKYSATVGKFDGDSDTEIAIPNNASYYVIDYKQSANVKWNCFKGNSQRTGNAGEIFTSVPQNKILPQKNYLADAFPNPFNPTTKITYELQANQKAKLTVFNVLGEVVREFELKKANGFVEWNGTNFSGKQIASGVYFYELRTENFS